VIRDQKKLNLLAPLRNAMVDEEVFWHLSLQFHHVDANEVEAPIKCMLMMELSCSA